jgi:hypothetical protein
MTNQAALPSPPASAAASRPPESPALEPSAFVWSPSEFEDISAFSDSLRSDLALPEHLSQADERRIWD